MAFGGDFGPDQALLPFGIISNIKGEAATGYDADGRIKFADAAGREYTPERIDTLVIVGEDDQTPPLAALVAGVGSAANADAGLLVTAAPKANEHGLPTNFGPGRGRWSTSSTGTVNRFRIELGQELTASALPEAGASLGQGSVGAMTSADTDDVQALVRNYHGDDLDTLKIVVECVHSVQN